MAKAPGDVSSFAGDGAVWFKVYQITAVTNGGSTITFPAQSKLLPPPTPLRALLSHAPRSRFIIDVPSVSFTIPKNLPSGQYLVRMEAIALHSASTFQGAQFYVSPSSFF